MIQAGASVATLGVIGHGIFKSKSDFSQRLAQVPDADKMRALTKISAQGLKKVVQGMLKGGAGGGVMASGLALGLAIALAHNGPERAIPLAYVLLIVGVVVAAKGLHEFTEGATDYVQANHALSHLPVPGM